MSNNTLNDSAYKSACASRTHYRRYTDMLKYTIADEDAAFIKAYVEGISHDSDRCAIGKKQVSTEPVSINGLNDSAYKAACEARTHYRRYTIVDDYTIVGEDTAFINAYIAKSSNGRKADFESVNAGSTPTSASSTLIQELDALRQRYSLHSSQRFVINEAYDIIKKHQSGEIRLLTTQEIAEVLCTADTDEHGIDDWKNYRHMAEAIAPFLSVAPARELSAENVKNHKFDTSEYALIGTSPARSVEQINALKEIEIIANTEWSIDELMCHKVALTRIKKLCRKLLNSIEGGSANG